MAQRIVSFNFNEEDHLQLAQWLDSVNDVRGRRTALIVEMLEASLDIEKPETSLDDIMKEVEALKSFLLTRGRSISMHPENVTQELTGLPDDVLDALDALAEG